ncbi:RHS repeat domain-containing protein [Butyrivibrio fibrisolvens]|uniref:RHS repeat domain-containing protein n=1 Tax=Butyrivibrio fibrisolvens TaxID=831 RepID=UPI0020C03B16|nr:RHS repeat-associated core domain-containing protein [Butyrivibrio fibrisolvens]
MAFSYNELNKLSKINDWLGTTTIENDIRGRLSKVTDYQDRTVAYEYNSIGEKTKLTYPDGRQALYSYDEEGKLSSITSKGIDTGFDEKTSYAYDEIGRLIEKLLPNGVKQDYSYLPGGNLESMTSTDREGILDKYFYSYNNSGLISGINRERRELDAISGQYDYQYDEIGRLTRSNLNGELRASYEYDAFGNRTSLIESDTQTTYRYDSLDRLVEAKELNNSQAIVRSYDYDKRGNQTNEYVDGLLNKTFTFDATNMLSKVIDSEKGELENQYNGLGFRVASIRPEERIEYLCDLSRDCYNMLERTVNGETESFIYDKNVISMSKAGDNYYYLQDELGSPMYMTGTDGAAVSSYAFDDFGRGIDPFTGKLKEHRNMYSNGIAESGNKKDYTKEGNIIQPFAFTGYQEDEVSELKFAQARFYNAKAGRFQSEDIIKGFKNAPYTLNHYSYCFGNPVGFSDKNGKLPGWMEDAWNDLCNDFEEIGKSIVGYDVTLKDDTIIKDGNVVEFETIAHSGGDNIVLNYTSQNGYGATFAGATFNLYSPAVYGNDACFSLTLGTNFSDSKLEVTAGNTTEFVQGGSGKISAGRIIDLDGSSVAVINEVSYGETIQLEGFEGPFTVTEKTTIKGITKNWKDILDDAKKKVALGALIAALIFTVADLALGDEEVTAAMVIKYINANYPELAQVLKQYPEILQKICQTATACTN